MHIFSDALVIQLLDGAVACLFGAAATCRARVSGANLAGALILGCIAGLVAPILRETILHGQAGLQLVMDALPTQAFIGACAAIFALFILGKRGHFLFFWLDSLAICLGASLFAALALPELGIAAALILGIGCALFPGLVRDVALGDVAMFIDKGWYASCVALAAIGSLFIIVLWHIVPVPAFLSERPGEMGTLGGALTGLLLRYWKGWEIF